MTDNEIIDTVISSHPCFINNGVKMYSYLECKRMLEEALKLKSDS